MTKMARTKVKVAVLAAAGASLAAGEGSECFRKQQTDLPDAVQVSVTGWREEREK